VEFVLIAAELVCQALIISSLIAIYPLRLLRHLNPSRPWKRPFPIVFPASFDPAPLLYPPSLTMLVSMILSKITPIGLLPSIILGISSLPRNLIPSTGGIGGSNTTHWFLSCIPLLVPKTLTTSKLIHEAHEQNIALAPESLVLLQPLHQALCITLNHLTTTSLLPAELQLLSISLIELLLLASSPQNVILKALLWGGGIGVLLSCGHVLRWGIALARVPKWRFRRAGDVSKEKGIKFMTKPFSFGRLGTSVFAKHPVVTDSSSGEEDVVELPSGSPVLKLNTGDSTFSEFTAEPGSMSAIEPKTKANFTNGSTKMSGDQSFTSNRRHTLPALSFLPARSSKRTPSGRRKRASSSSVQAFFSLTQKQATVRKWLYAVYVYICVFAIILIAIREYVGNIALNGNEPVGWALGYLFGDLPWFRMEVVTSNLQRWICLPPRSGLEHEESCYLGWVEHLRHASFGEANTRLILCAYWLAIIIVGLAIVFQLSAVYEVDTRRKVFHFMMVAMLLPATYVDPTFAALALSLMLAIFLLLDLFRASQLPPLSKSLAYFLTPYVDGRDLKGPVVISHIFLLIGCAIPLWLSLASLPRAGTGYLQGWEVPTREVSMVSGVICVGMGDAAASLIGRRYGRHKWIWGGGKSIEGSLAFATAVGLALLLAKAWLRIGGWPANNEDSWAMTFGKAGFAAGVGSLTEAVLTGGNDNVVVPVILWLCVKGLDI
jgi:dolichol kinase